MTKISLIAAVDENYGLGLNNQLLCHLPADLKHFKQITLGKPVIMGRKTFLSIGKPLPNRQNIVLTRQLTDIANVEIAHSLQEALTLANNSAEIMIIGGEQIFRESLEIANHIYITVIHHQFMADVYFPELSTSIWHCTDSVFRPRDESNVYDMTFYQYQRVQVLSKA